MIDDYRDKPRADTLRLLCGVADVMYAMELTGYDETAIRRTVRGMVEAAVGLKIRPAVAAEPVPAWGWHDGVWTRDDYALALDEDTGHERE